MVSTFQMLVRTDVLSIGEALKVTAIGLLVVFAVLAILILFIELLHFAVNIGGNKKKAAPKAAPAAVAGNDDGKRISAGVMASVPDEPAKDAEFIAAVSAAITAVTGKENGSFTIKSIKEK